MQIYEKIQDIIKQMEKFTDSDGNEWALLSADYNRDCIVAEFVPYHMIGDDSWQESDVESLLVDFEPQEIESVSGWEYPRYSSRTIEYDDPAFDRELAISIAFDTAIDYLREKGVKNAA